MTNVIEQMLSKYEIRNTTDEINALKEIIQKIVLAGLSRANFFNKVTLYGDTASRLIYKLDRFTDNLQFALISKDKDFDLSKYFSSIKNELNAYGLNLEISSINQFTYILKLFPYFENDYMYNHILIDIKIKFEVDINPPDGATYDIKYKLLPSPHEIKLYDMESLFAGKIHAILQCSKGRDLYDYVFFLANNTKVNIDLIKNKLIESNYIDKNSYFDINTLKELLSNKFKEIDYKDAKEDVIPFIKNTEALNLWSTSFFTEITKELEFTTKND